MCNNNFKTQCEHAAKTFETIANGNAVQCPYCDEIYDENDIIDNKCPECGGEFNDEYLYEHTPKYVDLESYVRNSLDRYITRHGLYPDSPVTSVVLWIKGDEAHRTYLNTEDCTMRIIWWTEQARCDLSFDACQKLNQTVEEMTRW